MKLTETHRPQAVDLGLLAFSGLLNLFPETCDTELHGLEMKSFLEFCRGGLKIVITQIHDHCIYLVARRDSNSVL
jgi:hypothetical protein